MALRKSSWLPAKYWNQTAKLVGVGGIRCSAMLRIARPAMDAA